MTDFFVLNDSSLMMTGFWRNCGSCQNNPILVKTDAEFNVIGSYNYLEYAVAYQIIHLDDGYMLYGIHSGSPQKDHFILKADYDGNILWAKTVGSGFFEIGKIITHQNDFLIAARLAYVDSMVNTTPLFSLIRLDSLGQILWSRCYNIGFDLAVAGLIANDSSILVFGGVVETDTSLMKGFSVEFNNTGDVMWSKSYSSTGNEVNFTTFPKRIDSLYYFGGVLRENSLSHPIIVSIGDSGFVNTSISYRKPGGSPYPSSLINGLDSKIIISLGQGLLVTDKFGSFLESHSYIPNFPANSNYYQVKLAPDSGLYLGGMNTANSNDMYLVKTDSLYHGGCGFYNINFNTIIESLIVQNVSFQEVFIPITDSVLSIVRDTLTLTSNVYCITSTGLDSEVESVFNAVKLYPNPTSDFLYLECENCEEILLILVFDTLGRPLQNATIMNLTGFIDMSDFKPGLYQLLIKSTGFQKNFKIVKI